MRHNWRKGTWWVFEKVSIEKIEVEILDIWGDWSFLRYGFLFRVIIMLKSPKNCDTVSSDHLWWQGELLHSDVLMSRWFHWRRRRYSNWGRDEGVSDVPTVSTVKEMGGPGCGSSRSRSVGIKPDSNGYILFPSLKWWVLLSWVCVIFLS